MKIVSVLLFTAALVASWSLTRSRAAVPESVHVDIQNDLKNIIADVVEKKLPTAKNLQFDKFWTETLRHNQVKATFVYSFENSADENPVVIQIEGTAILNKVDENPDTVTWSLDQLVIQNNHVDFQEPIHITAGTGDAAPTEEPAKPQGPAAKSVTE